MPWPFFRRRSPRSAATWSRHVFTKTSPTPAESGPVPAAPPRLRTLVEVIGVGEAATASGLTVTLLSIERYAEGLLLLFYIAQPAPRPRQRIAFPRLRVAIAGEPATLAWPMGGSSASGVDGVAEHRLSVAVAPPPSFDVPELVIEVAEITWEVHERDRPGLVPTSTDAGPWTFRIQRGVHCQKEARPQ